MAKKRGIRIRINSQRLTTLAEVCTEMLTGFVPENEHQELLRAYLADLNERLPELLKKDQLLYTINLKGSEAMAFHQLWRAIQIKNRPYESLIINNLIQQMSNIAA